MEKNVLFNEMLKGQSRTYFFDVKESSNGNPYLSICESKKSKEKEGEYETSRLFVFHKDGEAFAEMLSRAVVHLQEKTTTAE
jgi:hypothetical protein